MTRSAAFAWALAVASVIFAAAALVLVFANLSTPTPRPLTLGPKLFELVIALTVLIFPAVGTLIVVHQPDNRLGWVFLSIGVLAELNLFSQEYGVYAVLTAPGALPAGNVALWLVTWSWSVAGALFAFPAALFPDGRLPSGRWRFIYWLVGAGLLTEVVAGFSWARFDFGAVVIKNPFGWGVSDEVTAALMGGATLLWSAALIGAVGALITRYRRSRGLQRQQLKWFLYGSALSTAALVIPAAAWDPERGEWLAAVGAIAILAIPVSTAIAIFRYRLYDIDLLINRTVVYGSTTAAIALTFWVGILALQDVLSPLTSGSEVAVAASTLVSLALFQPIRRRVQNEVDRRFDRSRFDAARTLDSFADALRDEVDLDALRVELVGSVQNTMAPAHASLWLRERGR